MRFQLFSDLHKDVTPVRPIRVADGIDVVVVPGDVCEGAENAFSYLRTLVPQPIPVVFTLGNHEFYRRFLPDELAKARTQAPRYGIALLERNVVEIAGVRFVGGTGWTDYCLFGKAKAAAAMAAARSSMTDHRRIGWSKAPWKRFRPEEARLLHFEMRDFLATATIGDWPTVVVSHHAPSFLSIAEDHQSDLLSAAYASTLAHDLIEAQEPPGGRRIDVWCHGHMHDRSVDYRIGRTRVISNPHGYGTENQSFDPEMVVEVSP